MERSLVEKARKQTEQMEIIGENNYHTNINKVVDSLNRDPDNFYAWMAASKQTKPKA